jgi:hypothetical protein
MRDDEPSQETCLVDTCQKRCSLCKKTPNLSVCLLLVALEHCSMFCICEITLARIQSIKDLHPVRTIFPETKSNTVHVG